jgi:peptidoglycan-associated lipoprotein
MIAGSLRMSAVALLLAGLMAGCSSTSDDAAGGAGAAGMGAGAGGGASGSGITSQGLPGEPVPGTQEDLEVSVGDRVFFAYDSAVLSTVATQTLDRQGAWLKQYSDIVITIEGHTDERGTREYNLALGARRAAATRDFLVARGVSANRLKTISYGKERPVAVCDDISCWSQNRRAVTALNGAGS